MSVMKEDGTKRLIDQILASLKVGKIAIMDTVLSNTSNNPVQNKVIKQAIDNVNTRMDGAVFGRIERRYLTTPTSGTLYNMDFGYIGINDHFVILDAGCYQEDGAFKFGISGANYYNNTNHTIAPIVNWSDTVQGTRRKIQVGVDTKSSEERTAYAVVLFY